MDDINADLNRALKELYQREAAYADAVIEAATADAEYRIVKAEAYLRAEGTIQEREATALTKCADELRTRDYTAAYRDLAREKLLDVRAALSARQSILSASARVHETTRNLTP